MEVFALQKNIENQGEGDGGGDGLERGRARDGDKVSEEKKKRGREETNTKAGNKVQSELFFVQRHAAEKVKVLL